MIITQDKLGPPPTIPGRNPEGLVDVMGGIGTNGAKLKMEFLQGDAIIRSPECFAQGQHPLTPTEAREFVIG